MPELPDLQVFSANLNKAIKNKTVAQITIPVAQKLNVSKPAIKKGIEGAKVKDVYRDGKELFIRFGNGNVLALHLMLHGNLYLFDHTNEHKHTILELLFDDDAGLALTDWQKAATPTFNPVEKDAPDALAAELNYKYLKGALAKRATIKNVLLDQKVIRGIGNAYADEILWDARISPFSVSNKIPDEYIKTLVKSIKKVLRNAEKQIRKKDPGIITGEVRDFLLIHNAKRHTSPDGETIEQRNAAGRKTYYTAGQELFT